MTRKTKKRKVKPIHPKSVNLYKFIRLIVGQDIPNAHISQRWGMDQKNFYGFKTGHSPVPRIERLVSLARILSVDKHVVFEVASGTSAKKVYNLIKKKGKRVIKYLLTRNKI